MKAPARRSATDAGANGHAAAGGAEGDEDDEASSGWETASESDGAADAAAEEGDDEEQEQEEGGEWQEWDPRVSFFDNKVSSSMEDNLQYMYKKFGFFLPDAEYLADPEGLIKYLGAKLSYGKVRLGQYGARCCVSSIIMVHHVSSRAGGAWGLGRSGQDRELVCV